MRNPKTWAQMTDAERIASVDATVEDAGGRAGVVTRGKRLVEMTEAELDAAVLRDLRSSPEVQAAIRAQKAADARRKRKGKPMATKAKPRPAPTTHMRPMVTVGAGGPRKKPGRKSAKRAPKKSAFAGTWPAPASFVFPRGTGGHFSSVSADGKGGFQGGRATVKARRGRARRVRRLGPPGGFMWVDAFGTEIKGRDRWKVHHRGGLTLGGKRKKTKKAASRKPSKKKKPRKAASSRKKSGRSAAQRAAQKKATRASARARKAAPRSKAASKSKRRGYPAISAKASYSGSARLPKGFRSRRAAASKRRKAGHKNLSAIRHIRKGQRVAGLVRRNNPRGRGGSIMARQNPRRRRRRNPGMDLMGTAKKTIAAAIPAVAGGAIISFVDAKLLADRPQVVRIGGKVALAALASIMLRSRPDTAKLLMGAILGSLGYELGTRLSGGIVAPNKAATVQALGTLIREDPAAMSALIDSTGAYSSMPNLQGFESADVNLG